MILYGGANTVGDGLFSRPQTGLSDADLSDPSGHGTHVTGIITAAEDNSNGVTGVAPNADIYAMKALVANEGGDTLPGAGFIDIAEAIELSVEGPDGEIGTEDDADIITMSIGGPQTTPALRDAIRVARNNDIPIVASVGNYGEDGGRIVYPAKSVGVIGVSAVDSNNEVASFSSYGEEVEFAAPGVRINSSDTGGGYIIKSGTSMATPHVTGTIALIQSVYPFANFYDALRRSAVDIREDGRDDRSGFGIIDAAGAVSFAQSDSTRTAAITGDVRRIDGSQIANVDQLKIQLFRNGIEISDSPVQPDATGEYIAEVPVDAGGSDYTLQVDDPRFSDFSREITLQPQATERVDIRLAVTQEFRLNVTVANADGTQVKSTEVPAGNTREVQVTVTGGPAGADESEFSPIATQTIDFELIDIDGVTVGQLSAPDNRVTTNNNGVASTTFTAPVGVDEDTNVSARTFNADEKRFETDSTLGQNLNDDGDQAEIEVFTTGTVTGDIRDQNEVLIQDDDLRVSVEQFDTTSGEFEEIVAPTPAPGGQYNFRNLETGEQYRVTATFQGGSESATVEELKAGTNTRDIVIEDITVGGSAAVTGDIRRSDGSEIANVDQLEIQLFQNGVEIPNSPVQPNATGEYIAEVPVDTGGSDYTLQVDDPRFSDFSREITIQPQVTETVPIRLTRQQDSSSSSIDATRSLSDTEVTNGSTVTVTVEGSFENPVTNATLREGVDVTGDTISGSEIEVTDPDGGLQLISAPLVQVNYNETLTRVGAGPLNSESLTVECELTIPAETPLGTTIEFDGNVTDSDTGDSASVGGDTQLEVVANPTSDTVTVGGQTVPTEFTTETDSGERTVTADNAVSAINTFIENPDDVDADIAVAVINAFIASS